MDSDPVTDLGPLQPRGLCGYADLLLAYAAGEAAELEAVASLLGYQPEYRWPVRPPPAPGPTFVATGPQLGDAPDLPEGSPAAVAETPFWRLEQRTFLSPTGIPEAPPEPPPQWDGLPAGRPPVAELTRWNALLPRLRTGFAERADSTAPDIAAMIRRIETGRMLEDLPRLQRRRWGIGVQIIVDHSTRLIPFFEDQNRVALRLARLFPHRAVEHALALDGFPRPFVIGPHGKITAYRLPRPGTLVVALGDLGCLARNSRQIVADWEALGRRLSTAGCRPVALTPCPPSRWLPERLRPWTMVAWDRRGAASRFAQDELDERAERLLRLVSPAVRIEPGLLRDIRRLLGAAADAGTEADLWQHSDLMGRSSVAATLDPDAADRLRKQFARIEPPDLRVKVVETLRRWRGGDLAKEVWFEELLCLDPETRALLPESIGNGDVPVARRFLKDLAPELARHRGGPAWYRRLYQRASPAYHDSQDLLFKAAQQQLYLTAHRGLSDPPPPPDFDPSLIAPGPQRERPVEMRQVGGDLVAAEEGASGRTGSPLATLRTANGLIAIVEGAEAETAAVDRGAFWQTGEPPAWAEDWGWDDFGAWVTFSLAGKSGEKAALDSARPVPDGVAGNRAGALGR